MRNYEAVFYLDLIEVLLIPFLNILYVVDDQEDILNMIRKDYFYFYT